MLVDYDIHQDDVPTFIELMSLRRRIRIRDGAQQWALLRDLEEPDSRGRCSMLECSGSHPDQESRLGANCWGTWASPG